MKIHTDLDQLPDFKNAAITTGTFDGVHKGHKKIIDQLKQEATLKNGESILITFHPHPRMVLQKPDAMHLLTTLEEKMRLLTLTGIDHVVVVPFTRAFSNLTPEEYITEFLVKNFHPKTIITGYDHHFGKDRKGDFKLLEQFSKKFGYEVKEIPEYILQEVAISSTKIRNSLLDGNIESANECLGYDYSLSGIVIHGNKIGRTLGYPTANISVEDKNKLIPKYGIYAISATDVTKHGKSFPDGAKGMMSIGIRPTIEDDQEMIEANLFDFNGDLYGKELQINFKRYIRPEIKFDNLDLLKDQIAKDEITIRNWWSS